MSIFEIIKTMKKHTKEKHQTILSVQSKNKDKRREMVLRREKELEKLRDYLERNIEKLELFSKADYVDEDFPVYISELRKSLKIFELISVDEMTEEEYHEVFNYFRILCEDLRDELDECQEAEIRNSILYADKSLDELISEMKENATNYNNQIKKDKIIGSIAGSYSLGAFDAVRNKDSNNSNDDNNDENNS